MLARSLRQFCRLPVQVAAVRSKASPACYMKIMEQVSPERERMDLCSSNKGSLNHEVVRFHSASARRLNQENETSVDKENSIPISERIEKFVKNKKVVIFMKGVPVEPMCGFSNAVVQVLRMHGIEDYDSHNVLADEELRQGIKVYSDWPTIPQVYFDGEFIGGCDILLQMHQSGELIDELEKLGIKSSLDKRE